MIRLALDWIGRAELAEAIGWFVIAAVLTLTIASTISAVIARHRPGDKSRELVLRVRSWWVMTALFVLAILLNRSAAITLFGLVSFLALKEYLTLIPTRRADRRVLFWAYLSIIGQYLLIGYEQIGIALVFVPVYMFLLLPTRMILAGQTEGFVRAVGTLHWGLMVTVFCLSHAAMLLVVPIRGAPAGGAGLLIYLVLVTQLNDVMQFVTGRTLAPHLGRGKIAPAVSPNKTWVGFVGGVVCTTALSAFLGPWLTPLDQVNAAAVGCALALAGFFGDLNLSSLKRDLGVKDAGSLIPGHGGVLDRVNSLTFTAPLLLHILRYYYG